MNAKAMYRRLLGGLIIILAISTLFLLLGWKTGMLEDGYHALSKEQVEELRIQRINRKLATIEAESILVIPNKHDNDLTLVIQIGENDTTEQVLYGKLLVGRETESPAIIEYQDIVSSRRVESGIVLVRKEDLSIVLKELEMILKGHNSW